MPFPKKLSPTLQFIWVMRIFAVIYLIGAILFFFMPEETFYLINIGPKVFKIYKEIPMPSEHFWGALATAMMVMLGISSIYSSLYPKMKSYVIIHLSAKVTSVIGFLYLFSHQHLFAYLLGALTDFTVILVVGGFFLRNLSDTTVAEPTKA